MNKRLLVILVLFAFCLNFYAQSQKKRETAVGLSGETFTLSPVYYSYLDSLTSLIYKYEDWHYAGADTLQNPYYFRLFTVPTYYAEPVKKKMSIGNSFEDNDRFYDAKIDLQEYVDHFFSRLYVQNPSLISETEREIKNTESLRKETYEVKPDVELTKKEEKKVDTGISNNELDIYVYRPNFWKVSGSYSLSFRQNYFSDNWYKGGEDNNSFLATATIRANYNNKRKILFENTLEMRLGFQSSKSDKIHRYKTNSDLLRLTNKLGLRATKLWYYTILLQSWTQFHPSYRNNDRKVYSDFMSPFESTVSVGMDYKLNVKNFNISANISPFACRFKYVDRKSLVTSFGLRANHHSRYTYGSNVTIDYTWKVIKNVQWKGHIYYFTDYDLAQIDWENTFSMSINKYLATTLFVEPRFDDSVNRKKGKSYFQFYEWFSLGLNMSF